MVRRNHLSNSLFMKNHCKNLYALKTPSNQPTRLYLKKQNFCANNASGKFFSRITTAKNKPQQVSTIFDSKALEPVAGTQEINQEFTSDHFLLSHWDIPVCYKAHRGSTVYFIVTLNIRTHWNTLKTSPCWYLIMWLSDLKPNKRWREQLTSFSNKFSLL